MFRKTNRESSPQRGLVTEQEAAKYLAVAVATLQRWRWARKGPRFVKVGGYAVRYHPDDLDAFIAACSSDARNTAGSGG